MMREVSALDANNKFQLIQCSTMLSLFNFTSSLTSVFFGRRQLKYSNRSIKYNMILIYFLIKNCFKVCGFVKINSNKKTPVSVFLSAEESLHFTGTLYRSLFFRES